MGEIEFTAAHVLSFLECHMLDPVHEELVVCRLVMDTGMTIMIQ